MVADEALDTQRVFRVYGSVGVSRCPALQGSSDLVSGRDSPAMRFHSRLPVSSGEGLRHWAGHRGAVSRALVRRHRLTTNVLGASGRGTTHAGARPPRHDPFLRAARAVLRIAGREGHASRDVREAEQRLGSPPLVVAVRAWWLGGPVQPAFFSPLQGEAVGETGCLTNLLSPFRGRKATKVRFRATQPHVRSSKELWTVGNREADSSTADLAQ